MCLIGQSIQTCAADSRMFACTVCMVSIRGGEKGPPPSREQVLRYSYVKYVLEVTLYFNYEYGRGARTSIEGCRWDLPDELEWISHTASWWLCAVSIVQQAVAYRHFHSNNALNLTVIRNVSFLLYSTVFITKNRTLVIELGKEEVELVRLWVKFRRSLAIYSGRGCWILDMSVNASPWATFRASCLAWVGQDVTVTLKQTYDTVINQRDLRVYITFDSSAFVTRHSTNGTIQKSKVQLPYCTPRYFSPSTPYSSVAVLVITLTLLCCIM